MPIALPRPLRRLLTNTSLRWILTVPFVLPTIGAVALVGYLAYRSGQEAAAGLGRQLVTQTEEQVTQELKTYLQTPLLINRLNVDAVNQKQLDVQNIPALESALLHRLQQFDQVTAVLFASPQGTFRFVERFPTLYLGAADPARPDYIKIYALDNQGKRGKLAHEVKGLDVRRDRPFYQRAVTTGKPGWNPIARYGNSATLTLDTSQPVYDSTTKQLLGVFAVHLRLEYLSQFLHRLDISRAGQIIITDQSGTLIATSTQEQPYSTGDKIKQPNQFQQLKIYQSQNTLTRSLGEYLRNHSELLKRADQTQYLEFSYSGEPQYLQITPFQDQYGLNWRILTVIPKSYFLGAIQNNARTTVLLCLLTLGGAIMLGLAAANRFTARFTQLARVSREFAAGNLDQRLPTEQPISELKSLAQAFNQMADQLQQSFDRVQTALDESEARFTTIFRTSPDPMAIASLAEGRILEVNNELLKFFGYSRFEMIGRTALELDLWSNLAEHDQYRALLQQQGSVLNLEVQLRTKSGEVRTVLLSAEARTLDGQDCIIIVHRDISSRKAAELALQQSEARYRAIVEDQTELIARSSPDTTRLFVNDAYCRYFGLQREDLIGKSVFSFIDADDRNRVTQLIHSLSVANPTVTMENRVIVGEEIRWTQWINRLLFDAKGNVTEMQSVGRDITELKQIEAALRKSEASLLQAQQIAHLGSWELDLVSQNVTWSEELFRIFGVDPAELKPSYAEIMAAIPDGDRDILSTAIHQATVDGSPYEVEHRVCRPDGTIRYVISKGQAWLNDQQQISKLYGIVLDITERKRIEDERKQAEAASRQSEERFRQLAETVREGFFVYEVESAHYSYINPAYEAMFGIRSQTQQKISTWLDRVHPDDRDRIEAALQQEHQGKNFNEEYRYINESGDMCWLRSKAFPLPNETGTIVRVVGTVEDITDRKRLEQSLRSQAEEERLLATITQHIRQSLDLEQILATTVIEVQQRLNADRTLIFRLNQDGSGQVIQEAVISEYPITNLLRWLDECFPDECYNSYRQGIPRIVPDVTTDIWAECLAEFIQEIGVKSKIVAPIVQVSGESNINVWGLLIVHACSHHREWQASEANFLQKICNQLAIAIDQANLYQQLQTELTERKQTEAALRQSEARLAMAQQVAQVGYWEFDLESQTRTWTELTFYQWGLHPTQPEPNSAELFEMIHPDDRAALRQKREKTITQGVPYAMDLRVVHPDGSIHYLDSRAEPVFNAQGQVVKLIGTSVNITERKRIEAALQEREAMLRAIGDNLPKGFIYQKIYEADKGFYYSYISAGIERLLGLKPEAVLADPTVMRCVGFPEELALADRIRQESLKNLSPVELQMRNRTATGEIQWSSIRSVPRRLSDGRTVWDGVEVDITDLKRTEAALRASEELFRGAFDNAPIGISLVSMTGQFVKVNPRYCDLLGYTEAELLNLTFQEITHPADLEKDLEGFQQMMADEIPVFQLEKRYITKQGASIPVLMNAAIVRDHSGQPLYCVGQVQDIRDRLKIEQMKDEFISVVSHELRTPLTSIRGALGILGSGVFNDRPEKALHMLHIAINNSNRLVRLVDDVLSLERLESGKVQLIMEHCQIAELMQQAIDSVQAIADQAGITLSSTFLSASLWAAPDAIIQTLTNLLSNAIKFSDVGGTVWLKAEMGDESWSELSSPCIFFTVKDQGRGIPKDKLEVIFEQFQQVDVSDSRKKGGTGLGLAICKKIVQQHGGRIWVESCLGKGSTFYVALPLIVQDEI